MSGNGVWSVKSSTESFDHIDIGALIELIKITNVESFGGAGGY